jgi:solute:Na+ symporter, SSS family
MGFTQLDAIVIVVYLLGIAGFGVYMGGRQKSVQDYFLSERSIPWWAICLTIVATETSALTFLSLPGVAWGGSMVFLQLAAGYIIGRGFVALYFIPRYFDSKLDTAYALIETRFGGRLRRVSSLVFMFTRLFADGVRLYATAIPLALLLEGSGLFAAGTEKQAYVISIAALSLLTLLYVFAGGIRAVIWADVLQWSVYILGATASIIVLFRLIPGAPMEIISELLDAGKLRIIDIGVDDGAAAFFSQPYTLASGLIGGAVLSMASHGADHLIVQRVLAAGHPRPARRAMMLSGIIVFIQFFLFLFVGALLWRFDASSTAGPNEVFAIFIIEQLPAGLTGLIIAGVLAAAMSTLSSSISALSSATMLDYVIPLRRKPLSPRSALRVSRMLAVGWALVLLFVASMFIGTPAIVVELALSIASYTYGGLLGLFLLGILPGRPPRSAVLTGFLAGIAATGCVILFTPVAWTWYTTAGASATLLVTTLVSALLAGRTQGERR